MRISDWSSDVCSSDLGWHSGPVRVLGLDLGTKRIGVALSDSAGTMATPYDTVHSSGDRRRDHSRIAELAVQAEAAAVIVGMPLSLDGSAGPAAQQAPPRASAIGQAPGPHVQPWEGRTTPLPP